MAHKPESTEQRTLESLLQSLRQDDVVRKEFQDNPRQFLKRHGIAFAPNREIQVLTATPTKTCLVVQDIPISEQKNPLDEILHRANNDSDFFNELQANPKSIIRDAGFEFQEDLEFEVVRNTKSKVHIVLEPLGPLEPIDENISDSVLDSVSGGKKKTCLSTIH